MPDWFSQNAPKRTVPAVPQEPQGGSWFDLYSPTRKPASAEDFTPPTRSALSIAGEAAYDLPGVIASGVSDLGKLAYHGTVEPLLHPLRDPNEMPLRQDVRNIVGAQAEQFSKAKEALGKTDVPLAVRVNEALGRTAAGVIPLAGPAAASAGEKIGNRDPRGWAEAAALLAPSVAAKVGPAVAPKLATIAEQIAAKGGKVAKAAAPYALPIAMDAAASYFGHTPIYTAIKLATKGAKAIKVAEAIKAAEAAPEAVSAAAPLPVGTRLVKEPAAAPIEQAVSGALSDLQKPELPRRITTPPAPDLPPGYTPRTTVPKAKQAKASLPTQEPPAAAPAARPYFLKSPEQVAMEAAERDAFNARMAAKKAAAAAPEKATPSDITDPAQMPEAWRSRMGPPEFPKPRKPTSHVTKAQVDDLAKGLTDSGLTAREAIRRISKDSSMSAETRVRLMTALGKLAKAGAK